MLAPARFSPHFFFSFCAIIPKRELPIVFLHQRAPDGDGHSAEPFAAFRANHLAEPSSPCTGNQQIYLRKCIYGAKWLFEMGPLSGLLAGAVNVPPECENPQ